MLESFAKRLESGKCSVAVIGLGYVGLPLAMRLASRGLEVTGIDVDPGRVDALNRGRSPFPDISSDELAALVAKKKFTATCNHGVLASADVAIIDVPTPLGKTREPDISLVMAALDKAVQYAHRGQLLIIESTTYPGFTREVAAKMLDAAGLHVGIDVFLVFSPERIDPGNPDYNVRNTPKIVGGMTAACAKAGELFYAMAAEQVRVVSGTDAAEMVKLHENTFRAVNIALANEVLLMSRRLGLDPWEIIDAAATKPFGFMPFYPGPGLGGHCIPIDPIYLSWKMKSLDYSVRFIELADAVNSNMPSYVVSRLQDLLNDRGRCLKGAKIMLSGVAYKRDVGDVRESPALKIIELLRQKGAVVSFSDPYVKRLETEHGDLLESVEYLNGARTSDCVLIVTDHTCIDYASLLKAAPLVLDTRGVTRKLPAHANTETL